jgi:potassium/hydrogen antiporter
VHDLTSFGLDVLLVAAALSAALLASKASARVSVPSAALFLVAAAIASDLFPSLTVSTTSVERIGTVALIVILFDGGSSIGLRRFRVVAIPIATLGILGTFATAGLVALFAHVVFDLSWITSGLLGSAIAPTDPAVMFSVLGDREIGGASGTILEGESGANDPVGIALMISLVTAGSASAGALADVAGAFALQMSVGLLVGVVGGQALLWFMRKVPLPSEGLYPLRTLACVLMLFGAATLLHGSGFLAVFVAGVLVGDERAPYKSEIRQFHSALSSLGELVAFIVLGLTVDVAILGRLDVWLPGLVLGVALALVIRPIAVGLCLLPVKLERNERTFTLLAGLKGAVPILLGTLLLEAPVADADRLYGLVVVVVVFSVVVASFTVPALMSWLRIPTRAQEA